MPLDTTTPPRKFIDAVHIYVNLLVADNPPRAEVINHSIDACKTMTPIDLYTFLQGMGYQYQNAQWVAPRSELERINGR